ncbi:MAG: hypothetical protein JOZ62_22530, partial [Acidobacteriaceae bacterium]|nr:hypothetical protein [Acidobacteriaceae bacterium]
MSAWRAALISEKLCLQLIRLEGRPAVLDRWYKDAVVYSVEVETFRDGNGDGYGDFKGLCEQLPYIAGLGFNSIWLLPFHPTPFRDNGYDITDYFSV